MQKVAVIGVGQTKFSGPQEKTGVELFAEECHATAPEDEQHGFRT